MNKLPLIVTATVLALCDAAIAQVVPVQWDAAGQFSKELPIAAGKFVEACEKLPKGARVAWSFEATSSVDFNIHYHEGKQVRFPAQKGQVAKDEGTLTTGLEHDYCWMWTNKNATETRLSFKLVKG
jgi:hypothetical protein